jgi:hypothetical protein
MTWFRPKPSKTQTELLSNLVGQATGRVAAIVFLALKVKPETTEAQMLQELESSLGPAAIKGWQDYLKFRKECER